MNNSNNNNNKNILIGDFSIEVPIPPWKTQQSILAGMEKTQNCVRSCHSQPFAALAFCRVQQRRGRSDFPAALGDYPALKALSAISGN